MSSDRTITLSAAAWNALERHAKLGIYAADVLGPDEELFFIPDAETAMCHAALAIIREHSVDQILDRPQRVRIEPPSFDDRQAHEEGWALDFDEVAEEYAIVATGDGRHTSDKYALAFVTGRASLGDAYHVAALDWVNAANAMHAAALKLPPVVKLGEPAKVSPPPIKTRVAAE